MLLLLLGAPYQGSYVIDEPDEPTGDVGARCFDDRCIIPDSLVWRCTKL